MKLTRMFDEQSEQGMASTPPGMAHWKGSGPPNKTCRECDHYEIDKTSGGHVKRKSSGELKAGRCLKYKSMIGRQSSWPRISYSCVACKYFKQAEKVEPIFKASA